MLLDSADKAYRDQFSLIVDLEDYVDSSNSVVSAVVTILQVYKTTSFFVLFILPRNVQYQKVSKLIPSF